MEGQYTIIASVRYQGLLVLLPGVQERWATSRHPGALEARDIWKLN